MNNNQTKIQTKIQLEGETYTIGKNYSIRFHFIVRFTYVFHLNLCGKNIIYSEKCFAILLQQYEQDLRKPILILYILDTLEKSNKKRSSKVLTTVSFPNFCSLI